MELNEWLDTKSIDDQKLFWTKLTPFLENYELKIIMSKITKGFSIFDSHKAAGVLEKYVLDINRIIYFIS